MQAPVKNFIAEVSRLAIAILSEKNFIAEMSRLANAVAAEKNFRAGIVGRVRVFFVCVSGMMKAG